MEWLPSLSLQCDLKSQGWLLPHKNSNPRLTPSSLPAKETVTCTFAYIPTSAPLPVKMRITDSMNDL